jgi:hypothetical protein
VFRWIRIFNNQYIGFWVLGLILFALQEVPYMVMPMLKLESNPIMNRQESSNIILAFHIKNLYTHIILSEFLFQKNSIIL